MSLLDAHPIPKPGAYWPDGFRENAQAIADRVAAERDGRPRLIKTGNGYADHIGDAIAGYEPTPEIVPQDLGGRPARVIRTAAQVQADTGAAVIRRVRLTGAQPMVPSRMTEDDDPEPVVMSDQQRTQAQVLATMAVMTAAITPEAPA